MGLRKLRFRKLWKGCGCHVGWRLIWDDNIYIDVAKKRHNKGCGWGFYDQPVPLLRRFKENLREKVRQAS